MSSVALAAISLWLGAAPQAPGCAEVRAKLVSVFSPALKPVALLASPPDAQQDDGAPCPSFSLARQALSGADAGVGVEVGRLGSKRAAVFLDGPAGSGRYWTVAVAVESKQAVVGACLATETLAWRNLHPFQDQLAWHPLVASGRGGPKLLVWQSLTLDDDGADRVLIARAWRLEGSALAFDRDATWAQLNRFAATYRALAARKDNPSAALHLAVAEGLSAFTSEKPCAPGR